MPEAIEVVFKRQRLEYFVNPERVPIASGDYVVVEADRGHDLGKVRHLAVSVSRPDKEGRFRTIVRRAERDDLDRLTELRSEEDEAKAFCKERIRHFGLAMKLVDVESQLDGNLITFYFTAEARVDFRDLVKELASEFRTRIELRQIGARDSAKRLGGIGPCGREYCCSTWLKEFQPVTLKMAKNQGLALAPSKISGGCGRLMCCLMYEDPVYRELAKLFPKQGSRFEIQGKLLVVVANDYFREVVRLRDEEGTPFEWPIEQFPIPREEWRGAVRAKGAPGRGGSGSGCGKSDPKPTGMVHARGASGARGAEDESGPEGDSPRAREGDMRGPREGDARTDRGRRIPIERAPEFGGAPLLKGGRGRRPPERPAGPQSECTPADLVRFRASERRREDGGTMGSRVDQPPPDSDALDADLVSWADPPKGDDPGREGASGSDRGGRFRRRRRRGRRSGGGGSSSRPGGPPAPRPS
jgi:cell fate regulator YaaT (PSP1 superfamily)